MQSNSELIAAVVRRNDQDAFAQLVLRYERLVWTVAWRELGDYHATQDVTQETFLLAHRRLSDLRDPDSIGFWLSKIAQREAIRNRRQRPDSISIESIRGEATTPSTQVSPEHDELIVAIGNLPEHERIVTVLRFLCGHSVSEVATLTGRRIGTVTKQLSRAVSRLRGGLANNQTTRNPSGKLTTNQSVASHVRP